jgi:translation initiation factor 2B subunit (eIF-2B alpha/beta/delta family)
MIDKKLQKILDDKVSGSTELLQNINEYLITNFNKDKILSESLNVIPERFSDFEIIAKYVRTVEKLFLKNNKNDLREYLMKVKNKNTNSFHQIFRNLKPFIKNKTSIVTLSNSKTIFEVLKIMLKENKNIEVTIAESRPLFEGRILTKNLLKLNAKIDFIMDCQLSHAIEKCDLILLGADKILANGDVVNKVGSKNACIIGKYYKKPAYVLTLYDKISGHKQFSTRLQNSNEIWEYKKPSLKIKNYYFEQIPRKLITNIFTEQGEY